MYRCPDCHESLDAASATLRCTRCASDFPVVEGVADFSRGAYYDAFDPAHPPSCEHLAGLDSEVEGTRRRIVDFYLPLIEKRNAWSVLDCGCGNGLSVDLLNERGIDAWGIDLSALRKWQWRERERRDRLAVANGLSLPFPDAAFDAVISSGVIEHIGVEEHRDSRYHVRPLPSRDALRVAFLGELRRVTKPSGTIWLDFPNGAFPIDFWHGDRPGAARWHPPDEGFLPTFREVRRLAGEGATLRALSPHRRLGFQQAGRHWYGKLFSAPMSGLLRAMTYKPFDLLAESSLNPFLVVEMTNDAGA